MNNAARSWIIVVCILIYWSNDLSAQTLKKGSIFSSALKDSVGYHVWLPEGWNEEQQYPVILMYNYGALNEKLLASTVNYYANHLREIPNSIVVNLLVDMNSIGYNYENGNLTAKGKALVNALKNEILPDISKIYHGSSFRAYVGQSYAASYANNLFLNHPGIFNAYILMAPEQIKTNEPPFELNEQAVRYYNQHPVCYFLADGGKDIDRRRTYSKTIFSKISVLDSTILRRKLQHFPDADHNNIVAHALPSALEFLYGSYAAIWDAEGQVPVMNTFKKIEGNLRQTYGIGIEKSFRNYNFFLSIAVKQKDTVGLKSIINLFESSDSKGIDLRNFAYYCQQLKLMPLAKQYYEKAISKIKHDEINTKEGHQALVVCYREMAFFLNKDDPEKGWYLLEQALNDRFIKDATMNYDIGRFAVENSFNLKSGLTYLLGYANQRKELVGIINYPLYKVNLLISRAYFLLKDRKNAKRYVQMVIKDQPENKEALDLLKNIN